MSISRRRVLMGMATLAGTACSACSGLGGSSTQRSTTGAATTGGSPPVGPSGAAALTDAELQARVAKFLLDPDLNGAALLGIDLGASGDVAWVPYLVDLLRLAGQSEGAEPIMGALQSLTGRYVLNDLTVAFVEYGGWALANRPTPAPGYGHWKSTLYGRLDPSFRTILSAVDDPMVLAEIHWGGVLRGGIPELNRPPRTVVGAPAAAYLTEDELVFGLEIDAVAVAYPERIMGYHELANDVVVGQDLAVSYCPLCRSARAHHAGGRTMQTSGLLRHSNKLMVARSPVAGSPGVADVGTLAEEPAVLWQQQTGEAINGPNRGQRLLEVPTESVTWRQWLTRHPQTQVLALPDPGDFPDVDYQYEPLGAYRSYDLDTGAWFPILATPEHLPLKATVVTLLDRSGPAGSEPAALAVDVAALARAGPTVIAWMAQQRELILAVPVVGGAELYRATERGLRPGPAPALAGVGPNNVTLADGSTLARLTTGRATWFAWFGEHPHTAWWPD